MRGLGKEAFGERGVWMGCQMDGFGALRRFDSNPTLICTVPVARGGETRSRRHLRAPNTPWRLRRKVCSKSAAEGENSPLTHDHLLGTSLPFRSIISPDFGAFTFS